MLKKGMVVVGWFAFVYILLLCNIVLLLSSLRSQSVQANAAKRHISQYPVAASNDTAKILKATVIAGDARTLLLESFLKSYNSPLAPLAQLIVEEADKNSLDYRLVVAIAMCESNLGKRVPSSDSYNPFGIAVYTNQKNGKKFDNWEHAIIWVSRYIKEKYYDLGLTSLKDIGAKWAPPSVNTGDSWSHCVDEFQQSIQ